MNDRQIKVSEQIHNAIKKKALVEKQKQKEIVEEAITRFLENDEIIIR